jgi:hypothetical protein
MALEWDKPQRALILSAWLLLIVAANGWQAHTIRSPVFTVLAAVLVVVANADAWKHSVRLVLVLFTILLCLGAPKFHYSLSWLLFTFVLFAALFYLSTRRTNSHSFSQ